MGSGIRKTIFTKLDVLMVLKNCAMHIGNKRTDDMTNTFIKFRRTNVAEMRPYIAGEDLTNISVSKEDDPDSDCGMVARNPSNHKDQWYVARAYFDDNFEPVE